MARNKSKSDADIKEELKKTISEEKIRQFLFQCITNKYRISTPQEADEIIRKKKVHIRILEHKGMEYVTIVADKTKMIGQRPATYFLDFSEEKGESTLQTLKEYILNNTDQGESESSDQSQESATQGTNKSSTPKAGRRRTSKKQ